MTALYSEHAPWPAIGIVVALSLSPNSGAVNFPQWQIGFAAYQQLDASASEALLASDEMATKTQDTLAMMVDITRNLLSESRPIEPKYGALIRKRFWDLV